MKNRKTSMQELFDNLEAIDIKVPIGVKSIFLEKEKKQIIEAFDSARNIQDSDEISITYDWVSSENYYNETYNQNK